MMLDKVTITEEMADEIIEILQHVIYNQPLPYGINFEAVKEKLEAFRKAAGYSTQRT